MCDFLNVPYAVDRGITEQKYEGTPPLSTDLITLPKVNHRCAG